jgi:hypothetical protein
MNVCRTCKGAGAILGAPCPRCAGRGTESHSEPEIPAMAEKTADVDQKPEGDKPADKGKQQDKPAPKYTDDDVQQRIDAALKAERDEAKRLADKDKTERERKEAEKRGEFETVATQEKEARITAERERDEARVAARGKDVDILLRDHLADKHPDYITAAKWIRPAIAFDATTKDDTLTKRIEEAAESYVKDNPRSTKGGAAPAPTTAAGIRSANLPPKTDDARGSSRWRSLMYRG